MKNIYKKSYIKRPKVQNKAKIRIWLTSVIIGNVQNFICKLIMKGNNCVL